MERNLKKSYATCRNFTQPVRKDRRKRPLTCCDKLDENENTRTPDGQPSECKGKESKGGRWIPRLQEAKKDAASCENLWVGASNP